MKETENNINDLLKKILVKSNIDLTYLEKIKNFLTFLLNENLEMNLISRKLTLKEIIYDHFFDCLVCWDFFKNYSSITDLGSGGGLPGLLLSILFPQKKITLIEKSIKKNIFLKKAINHINLKNVIIVNGLVNEQKITSEVITCRAFKDINTILSFTKKFLNNNGHYVLYKGKMETIRKELSIAEKQFKINSTIHRINEITEKERHVVIVNKIKDQL